MSGRRVSLLGAAAAASNVAFGATLAARIAGKPFAPSRWLVVLAAAAFALTVAQAVTILRSIRRGPPARPFDLESAARCGGADAEAVRRAAAWRDASGGAGYVRPALRAVPALLLLAIAGILSSGLLNVMFRIEGTWIQYASSGRDLDLRSTYRDLSLGTFADPSNLRYGVVVGEIRPSEPARLVDVEVVDAAGARVAQTVLGRGRGERVGAMHLHQWAIGPGARVTVVHAEKGQLFDEPFPLWPTGRPGEYAESIEGGDLVLETRLRGWGPDPAATEVRLALRRGGEVLFEGPVKLRRIYQARDGYAIVPWEIRPYVGLGIAHRTYRTLTLACLAAAIALALAWPLLRARPFWYREEPDGSTAVYPPSACGALLRRSRR